MRVEKKVVKFLIDKGYTEKNAWFKDLAIAISLVKKDTGNMNNLYSFIAEKTGQSLNTVTFHFHRAYEFGKNKLNSAYESPKDMISNLVQEYWYGKQEDR